MFLQPPFPRDPSAYLHAPSACFPVILETCHWNPCCLCAPFSVALSASDVFWLRHSRFDHASGNFDSIYVAQVDLSSSFALYFTIWLQWITQQYQLLLWLYLSRNHLVTMDHRSTRHNQWTLTNVLTAPPPPQWKTNSEESNHCVCQYGDIS